MYGVFYVRCLVVAVAVAVAVGGVVVVVVVVVIFMFDLKKWQILILKKLLQVGLCCKYDDVVFNMAVGWIYVPRWYVHSHWYRCKDRMF